MESVNDFFTWRFFFSQGKNTLFSQDNMDAAPAAYGDSLYHMWWQPLPHVVAAAPTLGTASIAYGAGRMPGPPPLRLREVGDPSLLMGAGDMHGTAGAHCSAPMERGG